jgi:hypothetical protein
MHKLKCVLWLGIGATLNSRSVLDHTKKTKLLIYITLTKSVKLGLLRSDEILAIF